MWSLGCLITALFTGSSIFANNGEPNARNSTSVIHLAAANCDLSSLNNGPLWENVDKRAKQLTKDLLVLDDVTRLTADEALRQPWFNEGLRARNLAAWYKNVIAGWVRSRPNEDLQEDLKLFIQAGIPPTDVRYFSYCILRIADGDYSRNDVVIYPTTRPPRSYSNHLVKLRYRVHSNHR